MVAEKLMFWEGERGITGRVFVETWVGNRHDEEFRNELYALDSRYNAAAASAKHRMQEKYKKTFEETGKPEADKQLISNGIF